MPAAASIYRSEMHAVQSNSAKTISQVLGGRNLNQVLDALFASQVLSAQQRGAIQDISFGTLRNYGRLRAELDQLLHKPVQDRLLQALLLTALYQLQFSKTKPYAVVDHAVAVAHEFNRAASSLVNAVLRNFLRNQESLSRMAETSETGRYSYPQWWIDTVRAQYGDRAENILLEGNRHPPMILRVNRRRIAPEAYMEQLLAQDLAAEWNGHEAIKLQHPVAIQKLPGFSEGLVSVQDAGAQFAAHLLDLRDGMHVLDACCAPGGKTAHLLELADIDLLAMDKSEQRMERVRESLSRLGLSARLQVGDAATPQQWWDGRLFQRILADVPCSASGVVRRHPDIKWLRRPEDIENFATQQVEILDALWQLLATDGKLLYVTCSIFVRENNRVIDAFLRQHDNAMLLPLSLQDMRGGQLLPNEWHDGFYYALLHKRQ